MGFPLGIHRIGEGHIRIGKGTENRIRGLGHLSGSSQQLFLGGRQGMGLPAAQVSQVPAVALQLRAIPVKALQRFIGNRHNLRRVEAARSAQGHGGADELTGHGLVHRIAGVLVPPAHTVIAQPVGPDVGHLRLIQIVIQTFPAFPQPSGKGAEFFPLPFQGGEIFLPGFVRGVQVLNGPLVLRGDLAALGNFLGLFHHIILPGNARRPRPGD